MRRVATGGAWLALVGLFVAACGDGPTHPPPPGGALDLARPWATAAPSEVGMDGDLLGGAVDAAHATGRVRSLLVVRRGAIVLERYFGDAEAEAPEDVRSVTKSVVSMVTGIALERGALTSLDQSIADVLRSPDFGLRPEHGSITVRHLLTMTGGFQWSEADFDVGDYNEWVQAPDPVAFLLARPLTASPGEAFEYNSAAAHLLSVVLEEATGMSLPDYADAVLFRPLGITRRVWEPLAHGVNGGSGLDLRPRDLARLGQLMLQDGWSGSRPVIPRVWIDASTTRRFSWTLTQGPMARISYGFLWWLDLDRDAFFAEGYRGQFLYIVPGLDLVVVVTTDRSGGNGSPPPAMLRNAVASIVVDRVAAAVR